MNDRFYILPKILFEDEKLSSLSIEAKVLFSLLRDRADLSEKNGWIDESGRVYIYFTIDEAMELLGVGSSKCVRIFKELERTELIKRKRQGLGKPVIIYVSDLLKQEVLTCHFSKSGVVKNESPDLSKEKSNNTYINNTDFSDTESIFPSDGEGDVIDEHTKRELLKESLKSQINSDVLALKYDEKRLEAIIGIMADAMLSKKRSLMISGDSVPQKAVKKRLLSLDETHIEYVLDCLEENKTDVKNIKSYILTALYNAPLTIDMHYMMRARRDMCG